MTVPDAIGTIPTSTSATGWVIRLIGLWITAAVLWFVGFLCILQSVRFMVRGVEVSDRGLKLWRYARPIAWTSIEAISVEPQIVFSRLFRLHSVARRLTFFERKAARGGKSKLWPHYLPSFFFADCDFESLCRFAFSRRFEMNPTSIDTFVTEPQLWPNLQSMFGILHWQRIAISILIALGLTCLMYKRAISNYAFNSGNVATAHGDIVTAKKMYEWAVQTDPANYGAWFSLGNSQILLGNIDEAKKDLEKSIFFKPDFVEPRISLSYLSMRTGDTRRAKELIDTALSLNPLNPFALLNRCDLEYKLGQYRAATEDARMILSQDSEKTGSLQDSASCLLARCRVRLGEPQEARRILNRLGPIPIGEQPQHTNVHLRLLAEGETALALHQLDAAERFFLSSQRLNRSDPYPSIGLANLYLERGDVDGARNEIAHLSKVNGGTAQVRLLRARFKLLQGDRTTASSEIIDILSLKNLDGAELVQAGNLLVSLNELDRAALCAQRALAMDSRDRSAKTLLASVAAQRNTLKPEWNDTTKQ
jgi:tetratricopeptide (TPR) repeat protein